MDIAAYNRSAWDKQSRSGTNRWCQPVGPDETQAARRGEWSVVLTPQKKVPTEWFGDVTGKQVLCLASGGGQQAPILAAAGARVTSFDNSDEQLAKDRLVAERDLLLLKTVRGDMADLSAFSDGSFDLIFHPVSNVFAENLEPVWKECARVLKRGGSLLSGFFNPVFFLFDHDEAERTGALQAKYPLPYSDLKSLPAELRDKLTQDQEPYVFGHTLEQQLRGQLSAGLVICDLYEDGQGENPVPLNQFTSLFFATLARKLS